MIAYLSKRLRGQSLAAAAIKDFCGKTALSFYRRPSGKPYANDAPYFSCSHSHGFSLCVVSNYEIGADIELNRNAEKYMGVARRFFHPEEFSAVTKDNFFEIFTAKEAYVKFTETGVFGGMDSFSVISGKVGDVNIIHFKSGDCICAAASKNEIEVEIKWIY